DHPMDASTHLLKAANMLVVGLDLDDDTAVWLLAEWDQANAVTPYPEKELRRKCQEARKAPHFPKGHPAVIGYLLVRDDPMPHTKPSAKQSNGHHAAGQGAPTPPKSGKVPPEARSRCLADIEVKAVEWLWEHWIPLGKQAILDGDPGLGKSTVLCDLAARITT